MFRHKNQKQRTSSTSAHPPASGPLPPPTPKHKLGEKLEKGDKQPKRPQTPFHHRSAAADEQYPEPQVQRLCLRPPEEGYPSLHHVDTAPAAKAPTLHAHGPPSDLAGSPQPPPLSPHPCVHGEGEPATAKSSSTPVHQPFYPPSVEPCMLPQKPPAEEPHLGPMALPLPPAYAETLEPAVFVGSAVNPNEDSTHNPWKYFNLSRKKVSDFLPPSLPIDKIRDSGDSGAGMDTVVSVTE